MRAIGFSASSVEALLADENAPGTVRGDLDAAALRLAGDTPLTAAIALFVCEATVPRARAEDALGPLGVASLERLGLAEVSDANVRARVRLAPFDDLLLASDPLEELTGDTPADHVGGVNPTTRTLAALTVRRPVGSALDLGTGCGVQAFLASRHATRVVATDVIDRALAFTAFNAALNRIENVETRRGDLFEPVAGERFGLVVANPPYVVSPDASLVFRDGVLPGGDVSKAVVGALCAHLEPGGFGHVLCSWGRAKGAEWWEEPLSWLTGCPCDALALYSGSEDPVSYAASWNQMLRARDREAYRASLGRWTAFYGEKGIDVLDYGAVMVRARENGSAWRRAERLDTRALTRPTSRVERYFEARDRLDALGDPRDLLGLPLRLVPDHRIEQHLRIVDGEVEMLRSTLELTDGLSFEGTVDATALAILSLLDGTRPVEVALAEVSSRTSTNVTELAEASLPAIERLVELGLLV